MCGSAMWIWLCICATAPYWSHRGSFRAGWPERHALALQVGWNSRRELPQCHLVEGGVNNGAHQHLQSERVPSDLGELLWFPSLYASLVLSFVAQKLLNQPSVSLRRICSKCR